MFDLTGMKALVTGATGGLGGAIARTLHAQGADIVISGTRADALEALAQELSGGAGGKVEILTCNLGDKEQVEALVPSAEKALGQLDILVNNAGITRDGLFMRMSDTDWDDVLAVNLSSAFRLSRACLRGMLKRRFGRIISITSVVGVTGNPGQGNYAASKAGMIGMTKSLAAEVATRSITVNCVAPGFIASPMTDALNEAQRDASLARIPAGRFGEGADIAAAVSFLASREASYITGQTLHVNGGMAM
ncbi:MAG: 3-oxoacyl-[acyl-carrier-protein] reductase, partial [Hyphomicrobiales bacterium]|nr:3-oxoacyl-[acyl-carrier-protein] reductase [Hyphomicrobiales bacterium]